MTDKTEIEFFLAVNEDGDFELDVDAGDARDRLLDNAGGLVFRVVKLTAKITLPALEDVEIDIPESAGTTQQIEVEAAQ